VALGAAAIALATRRPAQGGLPATTLDSLATESGALVVSPPGTPSADSTRQADSASRADSGALAADATRPKPPTPTTGRLTVAAPPSARVTGDGRAVGAGSWRNDSLKPGDYVVGASIPASAGCDWASVEQRVRVRAGGSHNVTLTPRAC